VGLKHDGDAAIGRTVGMQQSHHCGIETRSITFTSSLMSGSNRTIVGLKREFRPSHILQPKLAAIAPLWD